MADKVQYRLERSIPVLDDLRKKKIFTEDKIRSLVKQREAHEYKIARRISKKADFLRYIEFEMNVEALRKLRRARMVSSTKSSISDHDGFARIKTIYDICKRKFHGDISIWLQYINFCKKNDARNSVAKLFAEALQYHPMNADLWILAAAWEWEENANIVAARILLQRALRLNSSAEALWHEYFRLELVYIAKILARREVLGIESGEEEEDDEVEEDEEEDDNVIRLPTVTGEEFSAFEKEGEDAADQTSKKRKSGKKEKPRKKLTAEKAEGLKTEVNPVLRGDIAMVVFRNAIKEISKSFPFRKGFLDIAQSFIKPRPLREESIQEIYDSIYTDFKSLPSARALFAQKAIGQYTVDDVEYAQGLAECVKEFWKSCEDGQPEMWEQFVEYMGSEHQKVNEANLKLYLSKTIDKIFSSATKQNIHSERLYLLQVNWILTSSTLPAEKATNKAITVLDKATAEHKESSALALQQIQLIRSLSTKVQFSRLPKIFKATLKAHAESYAIWREYCQFLQLSFREEDMTKEEVEAAYVEAVRITTTMLPAVTTERAEIAKLKSSIGAWFVAWIKDVEGIKGVRRVYKSMIAKSLPDLIFFLTCIGIEKDNLDALDEDDEQEKDVTRKALFWLYDKAIHADEKNEDTYLAYLKYLHESEQFEAANKVLWRANKVVASKDDFSERYRQVLVGEWQEPDLEIDELEDSVSSAPAPATASD